MGAKAHDMFHLFDMKDDNRKTVKVKTNSLCTDTLVDSLLLLLEMPTSGMSIAARQQ